MTNKEVGNLFANIIVFVGVIAVLSALCMFSWNLGVLYLFPNLNNIGYFNALAIVLIIALGHIIINFYINKFALIKSANININQNYAILSMLNAIIKRLDDLEENKDV